MNLILIQGRRWIGGEEDEREFEEGEMVQAEMETWKSLDGCIHGYIHTLCMRCTQKLLSTIWKIVKKTFQSGQKAMQLKKYRV